MRIVALAESDSYLKWAAALLERAPRAWDRRLVVVEGALTVSEAQREAALHGTEFAGSAVPRTGLGGLADAVRGADAVLAAAHGPMTRLLLEAAAGVQPRPVLVTGLPGISIPATRLALDRRHQADLMILHSHRETREFARLAAANGWDHRLGLSSLPFLAREPLPPGGTDLVFAAQALVPRQPADRERMARALVRAAEADPSRRVVVKLRGTAGERQTHREDLPYPEVLARLAPLPPNLVTSTEPMGRALERAQGLATVGSTAAIEAVARGVPVLALDMFGVGDELINTVFEGSGLLGGEDDLISRRFRHPEPAWLGDNYLHPPAEDDWAEILGDLVQRRRAGALPPRQPLPRRGGALREAWHRKRVLGPYDRSLAGATALALGHPTRAAVRAVHSLRGAWRPGGGD